MALIYTNAIYQGKIYGHGYEYYSRDVYCTCGKKIGTQTKYEGWNDFSFDNWEIKEYKFCPYCGEEEGFAVIGEITPFKT